MNCHCTVHVHRVHAIRLSAVESHDEHSVAKAGALATDEMCKAKSTLMAALAFLSICGCDDWRIGSGVDADVDRFAGEYHVTMVLLSSSCPFQLRTTLTLKHLVHQSHQAIAVSSGAANFEGTIDSQRQSFTVTRQFADSNCQIGQTITYGKPRSGDAAFEVSFAQDSNCRLLSCRVAYVGIAKREQIQLRACRFHPLSPSAVALKCPKCRRTLSSLSRSLPSS